MAAGRLIVEVYKYSDENGTMPRFEFVPCSLNSCLKRNGTAQLEDVIRKGFSDLPRRLQNESKQKDILQKMQDAGFGRINVVYKEADEMDDACVELTNITPVSMAYADARVKHLNENSIILKGRYSFSDSSTSTKLMDGQRLTIICSGSAEDSAYFGLGNSENSRDDDEICLNITYLEN